MHVIVKSLVNLTSIEDAIEAASSYSGDIYYDGEERSAQIIITNEKESQRGSFKVALFGTSNIPSLSRPGAFNRICAKQAVYALGNGKFVPYDGRQQASELIPEVQCLVWAKLLLIRVYEYMAEVEARLGEKPPFPVPRMRFIEACLAYERGHDTHGVYLVEEEIPDPQGIWRKWINNDSALPLPAHTPDEICRCRFLAFTQHVQYYLTNKLAYVSDYQGKYSST